MSGVEGGLPGGRRHSSAQNWRTSRVLSQCSRGNREARVPTWTRRPLAAEQIVGVVRPGREADRDAEAVLEEVGVGVGLDDRQGGAPSRRVRARTRAATAGHAVE
jgi:hypothetical protein